MDDRADLDATDFDVYDTHLLNYICARQTRVVEHIATTRNRLKAVLGKSSVSILGPPDISFHVWSTGSCICDGVADKMTLMVQLEYRLSNYHTLTLEFRVKVHTDEKKQRSLSLTPVTIPFDVVTSANKIILGKMQKSPGYYENGWAYLEKHALPVC